MAESPDLGETREGAAVVLAGVGLTERQRAFAREYFSGDHAGNAVRAYLAAFGTTSYNTASSGSAALLKDPRILAFLEYLRQDAMERVAADLAPWRDLAAEAQAVVVAVMRGRLRSRLELDAAREVLDRALGRPAQRMEHELLRDERRINAALTRAAERMAGDG